MCARVVNSHPASAPQRWLAGWLFATRFSGKNQLSHFARSKILILLTPRHIDNFLSVVIEWAASIGKILSVMVLGEKTEVLKEIGESLRERRLRLNLSQAMAAERSGISENTLRNFERGDGISLWGFVSLCRTYGHDNWVYELRPESIADYANRIRPKKTRVRAAKRKEIRDV